jgi:NAD(P) transhydrogenase subunit alpha
MYARNMSAFLALLIKDGQLNLDFDDEIVSGTCITHEGRVVHEAVRQMIEGGTT